MSGTAKKIDLIEQEIRARYDMSLKSWVRIRLKRGKSWRHITDELEQALGWPMPPITHSGLHRWWMKNQ